MERDAHEALLNELLDPELQQSRRTEILQTLRTDYTSVLGEFEENSKQIKKLSDDNADLVVSNSKLFRQIGVVGTEKEKDVEQKEFSETVTIESLEKGSV